MRPCLNCGQETDRPPTPTGRTYCSPECTKAYNAKLSSERMARTNRNYASARMVARNPMRHAATRERVSRSLRAVGHRPHVRGGNGRGPTKAQAVLAEALGWPMELVVPTGHWRDGSGYPTCYKLDIGSPDLRIAVEVDGGSHCSRERQAQDAKKEAFLRERGWSVLRFKNKAVFADLEACVAACRQAAEAAA